MSANEEPKDKAKRKKPIKIVVRRLPPYLTLEEFKVQIEPLPPVDHISFITADLSFEPHAFSRCYLVFSSDDDVIDFSNRFNRYVFVDSKGYESSAIVELSLFGKIPRTHPEDAKLDCYCGQVEQEVEYKQFLDEIENSRNLTYLSLEEQVRAVQQKDEGSKNGTFQQTPLTQYLFKKNEDRFKKLEERKKHRHDEKKRRKDRRTEEDTSKKTSPQTSATSYHSKVSNSKKKSEKPEHFRGNKLSKKEENDKYVLEVKPKDDEKSDTRKKDDHSTFSTTTHRDVPVDDDKGSRHKKEHSHFTNKAYRDPAPESTDDKSDRPKKEYSKLYRKGVAPGFEGAPNYSYSNWNSNRITAVSKDPSEKKKNKFKARPDREIYRPGQRSHRATGARSGTEGGEAQQQ